MDTLQRRIGLSLSGGGYRASAFHLGTMKKLNEMGVLSKVDVLSTISGGSITGAAWCLHIGAYSSFQNEMTQKLKTKSVIGYVLCSKEILLGIAFLVVFGLGPIALTFTEWHNLMLPMLIFFILIIAKWQFKILPVSKVIERAYDKFFFNRKTLSELNDNPVIAIGSSNLQTGRPFTFSRNKMSDSAYSYRTEYNPPIEFLSASFPIARAVMASSCVPSAFTPISIKKDFYKIPADFDRINPQLVDGGVYDNQGIQKITQQKSSYACDIIITSDAGGKFSADEKYPNTVALLIRTVSLFMNRIKTFQIQQNVYRNADGEERPIAYISLGWEIDKLIPGFISNLVEGLVLKEVVNAHDFNREWLEKPSEFRTQIQTYLEQRIGYQEVKKRQLTLQDLNLARTTPTNLTRLSARRVDCLIRHAENITELQLKLYCPMIL